MGNCTSSTTVGTADQSNAKKYVPIAEDVIVWGECKTDAERVEAVVPAALLSAAVHFKVAPYLLRAENSNEESGVAGVHLTWLTAGDFDRYVVLAKERVRAATPFERQIAAGVLRSCYFRFSDTYQTVTLATTPAGPITLFVKYELRRNNARQRHQLDLKFTDPSRPHRDWYTTIKRTVKKKSVGVRWYEFVVEWIFDEQYTSLLPDFDTFRIRQEIPLHERFLNPKLVGDGFDTALVTPNVSVTAREGQMFWFHEDDTPFARIEVGANLYLFLCWSGQAYDVLCDLADSEGNTAHALVHYLERAALPPGKAEGWARHNRSVLDLTRVVEAQLSFAYRHFALFRGTESFQKGFSYVVTAPSQSAEDVLENLQEWCPPGWDKALMSLIVEYTGATSQYFELEDPAVADGKPILHTFEVEVGRKMYCRDLPGRAALFTEPINPDNKLAELLWTETVRQFVSPARVPAYGPREQIQVTVAQALGHGSERRTTAMTRKHHWDSGTTTYHFGAVSLLPPVQALLQTEPSRHPTRDLRHPRFTLSLTRDPYCFLWSYQTEFFLKASGSAITKILPVPYQPTEQEEATKREERLSMPGHGVPFVPSRAFADIKVPAAASSNSSGLSVAVTRALTAPGGTHLLEYYSTAFEHVLADPRMDKGVRGSVVFNDALVVDIDTQAAPKRHLLPTRYGPIYCMVRVEQLEVPEYQSDTGGLTKFYHRLHVSYHTTSE